MIFSSSWIISLNVKVSGLLILISNVISFFIEPCSKYSYLSLKKWNFHQANFEIFRAFSNGYISRNQRVQISFIIFDLCLMWKNFLYEKNRCSKKCKRNIKIVKLSNQQIPVFIIYFCWKSSNFRATCSLKIKLLFALHYKNAYQIFWFSSSLFHNQRQVSAKISQAS